MLNTCEDCAYCNSETHPLSCDMMDRNEETEFVSIDIARKYPQFCGPSGRWFEKKVEFCAGA